MKFLHKLPLALATFLPLCSIAKPSANLKEGFYRVQNYKTNRYVFVLDNSGSLNISSTSADMGAVALYLQDVRDRFSDPASIGYVSKVSNKHDVSAQNTSLHGIAGHYVQIQDVPNQATDGSCLYRITPLYAGTNYWLHDAVTSSYYDKNTGSGSYVDAKNNPTFDDTYSWRIIPFTPNGDEYLGIAPKEEMKVGDKYYKPYLIGFDLKFLSEGMKAYYISDVKRDAVILKEITGTVPYNTPIIVECSSSDPKNNRVDLAADRNRSISGNRLSGQFYSYANHGQTAYKPYDSATMRVLMVKDGKLTYGTADADDNIHTTQLKFSNEQNGQSVYTYLQCLNANESYLKVPAGFPAEISVMTEEEYNATHGITLGDANGDGLTNADDVNGGDQSIVAMVLQKCSGNLATSDLNKDGKINIVDIVLLIKSLINKQ